MVKMKWKNSDQNHAKVLTSLTVLWTVLSFVQCQTYCEDKPKILYYRRGQAALVSGASDEIANHVVISNVNKEFLACVSSRNVEWVYEGEGEPSKFQESSTVDIQKYEDGSISYCLTSQITFYNKQSDTELSRHTGKYICREIGNANNTATVYLFASRKNSPIFLQSRKTLTLPLSVANITTFPMKNDAAGSKNVEVQNANSGNGKGDKGNQKPVETLAFTIPCVATHPDVTAKLYKKGRHNKFVIYTGALHEFDPKYGFILNASSVNLDDLSAFYGEYKCVSNPVLRKSGSGGKSIEEDVGSTRNTDVEDFVLITIVRAKTFKIFPPVSEVYTSGMLNLTCESDEPVIMKDVLPPSEQDIYSYLDEDDYGRDRSDDIVETTEKTEQKSHVANYIELAPTPGRTGEIQCLSEKSGKVLHTWRYRIIRKRADKLSGIKFNKREKSFTCKSKLGAPGRLSFVSCRTPSECRINRNCLLKSESCRGYSNSTRAFCERKTHFCGKIFYKGGSGLIRCIGEGIDEIRGFTDESVSDQAVRMGFGKLKASETAYLQLAENANRINDESQKYSGAQTEIQRIYEGESVNVTLRMGYYFFLYPVQWTIKFKNGSTIPIDADLQTLQVDRLTRTVLASITLPYTSATKFVSPVTINTTADETNTTIDTIDKTDRTSPQLSEVVAINALIPLRSSVDPSWKTISLPLTVFGKEGIPQPSPDLESEEVLVEPPLHNQQPELLSSVNNSAIANRTMENVEVPNEDDNDDNVDADDDNVSEEQQDSKTESNQTTSLQDIVSNASQLSPDMSLSTDTDKSRLNITEEENGITTTTETTELEGIISNFPNSDSTNETKTNGNSHESISGKAQDEVFMARSGLLNDDDDDDFEELKAQVETQYANANLAEIGVAVKNDIKNESVPTTALPQAGLKNEEDGDQSSLNVENAADEIISFTTDQPMLAKSRFDIESTTIYYSDSDVELTLP